jgi:hypothetical protein
MKTFTHTITHTRLYKLTEAGITHLLIPAVFIIAIGGIGVYVLALSKAATTNTGAVTSGWSGMCLDDYRDGASNGHKVDIFTCNKTAAQDWQYTSNETISLANGYCVGVDAPNGKVSGTTAAVQLYRCRTTASALTASFQQWKAEGTALVNIHSGLCMTAPGTTEPSKGTAVEIASCATGNGCTPKVGVACPQYMTTHITTGQIWHLPAATSSTGSGGGSTTTTSSSGSSSSNPPTPITDNQTASSACAPSYQTITVSGVQWNRTSNNWGGANACLNTWDGKSVSYLVQSQSAAPSGGVMGYPDVSEGCDSGGGGCTTGWTSKQISALTDPEVTWDTSQASVSSSSKYDTGADLWFSSTADFKTKGAELFIALNNQGEPPTTSKSVTIDGAQYYFYIVPQSGWNEIIFAKAPHVSSVTNLALLPFFQYVVSQNLMPASDYWVNASFGNEIWEGGTGLETLGISLTE